MKRLGARLAVPQRDDDNLSVTGSARHGVGEKGAGAEERESSCVLAHQHSRKRATREQPQGAVEFVIEESRCQGAMRSPPAQRIADLRPRAGGDFEVRS